MCIFTLELECLAVVLATVSGELGMQSAGVQPCFHGGSAAITETPTSSRTRYEDGTLRLSLYVRLYCGPFIRRGTKALVARTVELSEPLQTLDGAPFQRMPGSFAGLVIVFIYIYN